MRKLEDIIAIFLFVFVLGFFFLMMVLPLSAKAAGVSQREQACIASPNCQVISGATRPNGSPLIIHKHESKSNAPIIVFSLAAGVVLGYLIFHEPRDLTRASIRF